MVEMKIIAGNWKMNKGAEATKAYLDEFLPLVDQTKNKVIVCPPFTSLVSGRDCLRGSSVVLGAQNIHFNKSGAHTGAISAEMLLELGVGAVLIGHSERREVGDTRQRVQKKVKTALIEGLLTILCIGYKDDLEDQLKCALEGLSKSNVQNLVVAYEPVWAIGTGKVATLEQIRDTHTHIKQVLKKLLGCDVPVLYGGSVTAENAGGILSVSNVDGVLVGGASLCPQTFAKIVKC